MAQPKKNIVIIGAGFAGIRTTLNLAQKMEQLPGYRLVLIDRNSYHLFTPWLYERASTGTPVKSIKIPLSSIFGDLPVERVTGEVATVNRTKKMIKLATGQTIDYDYLLLASGSVANDFKIKGLANQAYFLKTFEDAEKIRTGIKDKFRAFLKKHQPGDVFQVVIGGGGFTGVEVAAEIHSYLKELAEKLDDDEDLFVVKVLEAGNRLLGPMSDWVSRSAQERLGYYRRIEVHLQNRITAVTQTQLKIANGDEIAYDVLVWTGGVTASPLAGKCSMPISKRGRVSAMPTLQAKDDPYVFSAGDVSVCVDPVSRKESLETIEDAYRQGALVATNIINHITGRKLEEYQHVHSGLVVPIRGNWAVATVFGINLKGWLAYFLKEIIHLRYFLMILPLGEALNRWRSGW